MNAIKNIINKELTRVFKDKKLIFSLFILPGVMIMIMYSLMGKLANNMMSDIEQHIPTIYIQNAPDGLEQVINAVGYQAELKMLSATDNTDMIKNDIKKGNIDLLVVFDQNFFQAISEYKTAGDTIPEVKTFYNTTENYSSAARENFVGSVLSTYQQSLLAERLGNLELIQVFYIDKDPAASIIVDEKKANSQMMSMLLPLLMNMMLFSGALGLGVDAITGEKERGTLSSMLLSPIKRKDIVIGKLISLGILSSMSAVIYTIFTILGIQQLSGGFGESAGGEAAGLGGISFSFPEIIQLLVILLVVVYLYVAMVALVAVYARTAKEANTYVMPLMIVVMIGSVMTMFSGGEVKKLETFAIPVYNSAVSIQSLLLGDLTLPQFGLTVGTTALLAIVITMLITKAFNSEKVMFNA